MHRIVAPLLAPALLLTLASAVHAQRSGAFGFGMRGEPVMLATQKSVQQELKLSDEQKKQIEDLAGKQREGWGELRNLSDDERQKKIAERGAANQQALAGILSADQIKRLKQISVQQQGAFAAMNPAVAESLELTNDQRQQIKSVLDDTRDKSREVFQAGPGQGARGKLDDIRKSAGEKINGLLTDQQKAKLRDLAGEPFSGEITPPDFGRRQRRGE